LNIKHVLFVYQGISVPADYPKNSLMLQSHN